jgi:integrase
MLGLLPAVGKDVIADTLTRLETPRAQPAYLTPTQCKTLLEAALRHDSEVFKATREEHAGLKPPSSTPKYDPIAPFTLFLLLTGCRLNEALTLEWRDVDLQATDHHGNIIGAVNLRPELVKTARGRQVSLEVCPSLRGLLAALKLCSNPKAQTVFRIRRDQADDARERLVKTYGAPPFRWKDLRSTCEVYLVNSPAIFGSASIYLAAQQLGHSVEVAQRHYLQAARGIAREARTLEAAMQIEVLARKVVDATAGNVVSGTYHTPASLVV